MFLKAETLVQTQWTDRYSTTCGTAWAKYWLKHWGMNCFMWRFLCVAGNQECCAERSLDFISHFGSRNQLKKEGAVEEETKDTPHLRREGKTGGENIAGRVTILRTICIILKELANMKDALNTGSFDGLIWENGFKFRSGLNRWMWSSWQSWERETPVRQWGRKDCFKILYSAYWEEKDVIIIWECHLTKVDVLNQLFSGLSHHRRELLPFKTHPGIMILTALIKGKKAWGTSENPHL